LETRHFFEYERAALRLSRQFRADVSLSKHAEVAPTHLEAGIIAMISFKDDPPVEYRHDASAPGEIVRVQAREQGVSLRESFRLGSTVRATVQTLDAPDRLVLEVTAEALPAGSAAAPATAAVVRESPSELRVEAIVGGGDPEKSPGVVADEEDEE
jgi:hypothetical protein